MKGRKGFADIVIVLAVVLLGAAGLFVAKPKFLHGDSKRADKSAESTQVLIQRTDAQGASAAASVAKIGEANAMAPESPAREFIAKEVPAALAKLPAPDPLELLAAEKRRSAVMEGRMQEATALYATEAGKAATYQKELVKARLERQAIDRELSQVAAERLGAERQRNWVIALAVLLGLGWVYARVYSITPASLGAIAADMRAGVAPIHALDTHLAPWLHASVSKAAKLASDLPDESGRQ